MELIWSWPEIFDTKEIPEGYTRFDAVSDSLNAWLITMGGGKPHENFGEVLATLWVEYKTPHDVDELLKLLKEEGAKIKK